MRAFLFTLATVAHLVLPALAHGQYGEKWTMVHPRATVEDVFFCDVGNTDSDAQVELLFAKSTQPGGIDSLILYDGQTGFIEWSDGGPVGGGPIEQGSHRSTSPLDPQWHAGPQLIDVDDDGLDEIVYAQILSGAAQEFKVIVVEFTGPNPTATPSPPQDPRSAEPVALSAKPNPSSHGLSISYRLPRPGRASIHVYNVSGRLVRALQADQQAGFNEMFWNGTDDRTSQVASGQYYYTLTLDETILESGKAIVLR